jgi:serine/threonine-protein kinase
VNGTLLGGRYRLTRLVHAGGIGDVWDCVDESTEPASPGRTVVAKLLPTSLEASAPGFAMRLDRDWFPHMRRLDHPGLVRVLDHGVDPAGFFAIMERVDGETLEAGLAREGRLAPARTMALVAEIAEALAAVHELYMVYDELRPGRILVRPQGTIVLGAFGLHRQAGLRFPWIMPPLDDVAYCTPEAAMGEQTTTLSDIHAVGAIAYRCLAGRAPFEGDTPVAVAYAAVRAIPPPLPPEVPAAVRSIVDRAMAKRPAERWPSAAALAAAAREVATAAGTAGEPGRNGEAGRSGEAGWSGEAGQSG